MLFSLQNPKTFYEQIVTFISVVLKIRKQNWNMLFVVFQIHDDLEKEPEYSGSGFGPDDEDSSSSSSSHQRKKGKKMKWNIWYQRNFELRLTVCIFLIGNAGHKGSGGHKSTNSKNHSQESISDKTKKQPEKPIFTPDTNEEDDLDSGSGDKIDIDETDDEDRHIISPDEGDNDNDENNRQSGNKFDTNSGGEDGDDDLTTEIEEKILKIDDIPSKLKLFPLRLKNTLTQDKFAKRDKFAEKSKYENPKFIFAIKFIRFVFPHLICLCIICLQSIKKRKIM